jgi:hypothetical protein
MPTQRTKKQNLEVIKTRLQVHNLPSKFEGLSANVISIFADNPELDSAIRVIIEQNDTNKRANGRRAAAENKAESLQSKLEQFLNPSKSEIVQLWSKFFGKATKADDEILGEIGAVSNETVREDLDKAKQMVQDAEDIAKQYQQKYGQQKKRNVIKISRNSNRNTQPSQNNQKTNSN